MMQNADWYPDPSNPLQLRYWDGQGWTEHTQPAPPTQPITAPAKKRRDPIRTILTIAGVILVVVVGISFLSGGTEPARNGSTASETPADPDFTNPATYAELTERDLQVVVKDPEVAVGEKYVIYGDVSQLDAATGDSFMRVKATATPDSKAYGDNVVVNVEDPQLLVPVVSGDAVKLFVTVVGALSYDTQIGGRTTVPEFTAAIVEVLPS